MKRETESERASPQTYRQADEHVNQTIQSTGMGRIRNDQNQKREIINELKQKMEANAIHVIHAREWMGGEWSEGPRSAERGRGRITAQR